MEISGKITSNKKNYGKHINPGALGEIQFGKNKKSQPVKSAESAYEEVAGINDLDENILNKNYDVKINIRSLRLEIRLERAEDKLKKVKEEQKMNEVLGLDVPEHTEKLGKTRQRLENEINTYRQEYRSLGMSYKIADTLSQANKILKEKTGEAVSFAAGLLPSGKERERLKYAKVLNQKLSNELGRRGHAQPIRLESLLFQAEKLNRAKI